MATRPPPRVDHNANKDSHILSAVIALLFIPTIFVFLRLLSRRVSRAGFWVYCPWNNMSLYIMAKHHPSSGTIYWW